MWTKIPKCASGMEVVLSVWSETSAERKRRTPKKSASQIAGLVGGIGTENARHQAQASASVRRHQTVSDETNSIGELVSHPSLCQATCERVARIDVLVIDDWAMAPLSEPERRDFWEIYED